MKPTAPFPYVLISFCLWIALLFPFGVFAEGDPVADVLAGSITVQFPHLDLGDFAQTALKPGDAFSVSATDIRFSGEATLDLHELGLGDAEPLTASGDTRYSQSLTLPATMHDGTYVLYVHGTDLFGQPISLSKEVTVDTVPPTGSLTATFTKDSGLNGTWQAHVKGSFDGTGTSAHVVTERTYYVAQDGARVDGGYTSAADIIQSASSTFAYDLPVMPPELGSKSMGYMLGIADDAGNLTYVYSGPFPLFPSSIPLIDHAVEGSVLESANYVPAGIPAGNGIPYSMINGLPTGDYYAVVFFEQGGCPTGNYQIGAFIPGQEWGVDAGEPGNPYLRATGTAGGGCMERFHIDSTKSGDWLWGALDPTTFAPAVADASGMPAFAICDDKDACDAVTLHDANDQQPSLPGISNVLFIPGIKGSNLYRAKPGCTDDSDSCDEKLWLPMSDASVPQLYLNEDGRSENEVYVKDGDLLTQAFGEKFTQSFVDDLASAEANGTFGPDWTWKPVAYDWRLAPWDIVHSGVQRGDRIYYGESTSTPYIQEQLKALAASSKTGKVTIVAYSNGGLVAKALMQELGDAQALSLIDKVVLVDVPQTGAPRAIGALLFGDKEGIPDIAHLPDLIMTAASARTFAHNSPMAYDLVPSERYVADTPDTQHPLVSFLGTHLWQKEQADYGSAIGSSAELRSFLQGDDGGRMAPAEGDLSSPAVLSPSLLAAAQQDHDGLDAWVPPQGLRVYEITGWGADTISGYELYEQQKSVLGIAAGSYQPEYRPMFVEDGDGTVPVQSALATAASNDVWRYWFNLRGTGYTHGTVLEMPDLRSLISDLIEGSDDIPADALTAQPDVIDRSKHLYFYLHGTGDLSLCDSDGSCEGFRNGAEEDAIPDASHGSVGDVSYVHVPPGRTYSLHLHGSTSDSVSLDIQEAAAGEILATTTLADIPLVAGADASLSITNGIADASALSVDTDGDGAAEYSVLPVPGSISFAQPLGTTTSIGRGTSSDTASAKGSNTSSRSEGSAAQKEAPEQADKNFGTPAPVQALTEDVSVSTSSPETAVQEQTVPVAAVSDAHNESVQAGSATKTESLPTPDSNLAAAVPENAFLRILHSLWMLLLRVAHAALQPVRAS